MQRESSDYEFNIGISSYLPKEPVDMLIVLSLIMFAFYYIWRVAYLTPWYDELYTYYYFISRGPVYAAIHWPLPNNHVGFSVLSSIFNAFGNNYIGLRGVSFICAVLNPFLLFRLGRRFLNKWFAYCAMLLYFASFLVNDLAVQGRGYTLATTCFIVTIRELVIICRSESYRLRDYFAFAAAMVIGLYTLPSSIYWVIPTCAAAGLFLFINGYRSWNKKEALWYNRYFRKLRRCIITGLIAALVTFMLYLVIWLAIGSNLIVKDESSIYYGLSHVQMILRHPFKSALSGIRYMLAQPYIQSVPREGYLLKYVDWFKSLTTMLYPYPFFITLGLCVLGIAIFVWEMIDRFENSRTIFGLIIVSNAIGFQIIVLIQAKLPYYRVFSYMAVIVAISFAVILEHLFYVFRGLIYKKTNNKSVKNTLIYFPVFLIMLFVFLTMMKPKYSAQYGDREADCYNALYIANPNSNKKLCVLDCDQQYLLKFGFDIECENTNVEDCDYALIDRNMMVEGYNGSDAWKFYQTYETLPWDYINSRMHVFYENENFVLYKK